MRLKLISFTESDYVPKALFLTHPMLVHSKWLTFSLLVPYHVHSTLHYPISKAKSINSNKTNLKKKKKPLNHGSIEM